MSENMANTHFSEYLAAVLSSTDTVDYYIIILLRRHLPSGEMAAKH